MDSWRRITRSVGGGPNGPNAGPNGKAKEPEANGSATDTPSGKERALDEALWGLENFGNTCYCNSILQALYAAQPFRAFVESYPDVSKPYNEFGGAIAHGPIVPSPSPSEAKPNPLESVVTSPTKEKRGGLLGLGGKKQAPPPVPKAAPPPASNQPPPQPIILPPDPNFPNDFTLFQTIQALFHHLSSSAPHHPADPKPAVYPPGVTPPSAPVTSGMVGAPAAPGQPGTPGQPQGPSLLASLPPPSTPRGGGPYKAGTLGRGVVRPEDVLRTVRNKHSMFGGQTQQDAHEFLGFILNQLDEEVQQIDAALKVKGEEVTDIKEMGKSFIHSLFHGVLVNETRCLNCETTSTREESFLDLSIDIEQHSSLTACLRQFSHSEMLCSTNKFYCETCCGLVEAERRMRIKSLPNILGLHLKRFRQDDMGRLHKLFYRVTFPLQLRVPCTTEDTDDGERLYELFSVVVHIGNGPTHGHYVTAVRSENNKWVMCDDENIEPIEVDDLANYFGDNITGAGYVLFYQAVNLDLQKLGLKKPPPVRVLPPALHTHAIELLDDSVGKVSSDSDPQRFATPDVGSIGTVSSEALSSVGMTPHAPPVVPVKAEVNDPAPAAAPVPSRQPNFPRSPGISTATSPSPATSATSTPVQEKSKWYSLKRRESVQSSTSAASTPAARRDPDAAAVKGTLQRQPTANTLNTMSTTSTSQVQLEHGDVPPNRALDGSVDLSSSMISTASGTSSSGLSSGALAVPGAGTPTPPTPSPSSARPSRAASTTVATGNTNASGGNYSGGSGLGRKLSGAIGVSKLGRSTSSTFKMGFGRKKVEEEQS
ncbi:hypothetical protein VHUM_01229 [Vanrija humicola]|uniref:Ubiquitin carboxyl-terminal hydrolase n=1 Tax=Vanrija humicola TaxID=5417 RepID=A0A7D8Z0R1_VANHU|nr:hypothetical protein VHUM_01229 [Vanrija humicola]